MGLALIGVVVLGAGVALGVSAYRTAPAPAPADRPVAAAMPGPASPAAPAFDIVRIAPDGGTVLAGRAEPGATVTVRENGQAIGQAQADGHGAWVMIPVAKLPSGAGELTLSSQGSSGAEAAVAPVLVVVPAQTPGAPGPPALALLAPPDAASRVLQAPAVPGRKLGLDTVDYDEHGAIRFSGTAPPQGAVRAYVDNGPVGDATAGPDGHWALSPPNEVQPGVHTLRLDQITGQGHVASRVEVPFQRESLALSEVAKGQVVVQPGQNLWRLARRAYGAGIRYTVIVLANRDQIRDARMIYPGQVFATPGAGQPMAIPAAAR